MGFRASERVTGVHNTTLMALVKQVGELLPDYYTPETISCCASNLTATFSTIIVGRAGEPVSVFNLDAPQLTRPRRIR
jgi:hypothetical protein